MHCLILGNAVERSHGGHRIASHLRYLGWDCEVLDYCHLLDKETMIEFLKQRINKKTKFIGFSHIFLWWRKIYQDVISWVKHNHPDIMILSGAQNFYMNTSNPLVDYNFAGYSEWQLEKFLKWKFSNGHPVELVHGNVIDCNNSNGASPMRDPFIKYEKRDYIMPWEMVPIEFSRGCKFACAFCDLPFLGVKGDYTRDVKSVEDYLKYNYDNFGVHRYLTSDETFNDATEKIAKYADLVQKLDFTPYFVGYIRLDLLIARPKDKELLEAMNFVGQFYGIESFNHDTRKAIKKGMHPDKIKQGLLDIQDFYKGKIYRGTVSLIAGLPHETLQTLYETKQWILKNWIPQNIYINGYLINKMQDSIKGSAIDNDLAKYGYEDTGQISPKKNLFTKEHNDAVETGQAYQNIVWKNKHMTYNQANNFAVRFHQSAVAGGMKIGAWLSPSAVVTNKHIKDLFDLPAGTSSIESWYSTIKDEFIPQYIEKKLGNSF